MLTPEVNADELNLPAEVARKLKGKRVTIVEVREGFLLKPVEDPIREARGILKGKGFNVEKYLQSKQLEKDLGNMSDYYVLDACALIAFLNDEAGADVVEELLRKSNHQEPNLFLHRLNLLEVYYGIYREVGPEISEQTLEKIRALPVTEVTEITQEVFLEAGRLKATYRLSLADSIAAAEAKVRGASLVTADHHEFDLIATREDIAFRWIR